MDNEYRPHRGQRKLTSLDTVKYHAYLRKMTRYNPTRGGEPGLPTPTRDFRLAKHHV